MTKVQRKHDWIEGHGYGPPTIAKRPDPCALCLDAEYDHTPDVLWQVEGERYACAECIEEVTGHWPFEGKADRCGAPVEPPAPPPPNGGLSRCAYCNGVGAAIVDRGPRGLMCVLCADCSRVLPVQP